MGVIINVVPVVLAVVPVVSGGLWGWLRGRRLSHLCAGLVLSGLGGPVGGSSDGLQDGLELVLVLLAWAGLWALRGFLQDVVFWRGAAVCVVRLLVLTESGVLVRC